MDVRNLNAEEIADVKRAYTTRRVPEEVMQTLLMGDVTPRIGDLVMARVDQIGSHRRIELPSGRKATLAVGDTIMVAFGNRYAPDQFEAVIGTDLSPCELVAGGGVAAHKICRHDRMREPTRISPLGLVGDGNAKPINLDQYAVNFLANSPPITTVFVAGTAMNAGKTMTSACLVRGFRQAGFRVAGIKSTGTGSGGDLWFMRDMGANTVLDFTDGGLPSTYLAPQEVIEKTVLGLIGHAAQLGNEVAVVEIADGLHHEETAALLRSPRLRQVSKGLVFAANDALGAEAGLLMLRSWGWHVIAFSGQLTRSPLAMREAHRATSMPVVTAKEIQSGILCQTITGNVEPRARSLAKPSELIVAPPQPAVARENLAFRLKALASHATNGSQQAPPSRLGAG